MLFNKIETNLFFNYLKSRFLIYTLVKITPFPKRNSSSLVLKSSSEQ